MTLFWGPANFYSAFKSGSDDRGLIEGSGTGGRGNCGAALLAFFFYVTTDRWILSMVGCDWGLFCTKESLVIFGSDVSFADGNFEEQKGNSGQLGRKCAHWYKFNCI